MLWLWIALLSYFILAAVNIVDSFLLKNKIKDERVYVFIIGSLGLFFLLAIPFIDTSHVTSYDLFLDIIAGASFGIGLLLFFRALRIGIPSVVIPFIGGGTPILVALGSFLFLGERFSGFVFLGIGFLLAGGVLITLVPQESRHWWNIFQKKHPLGIPLSLGAMLFFAFYYIVSKYTFDNQGFLVAFTFARIGTFLAVIWFVFFKHFTKELIQFLKKTFHEHNYLYYVNQFFGGIGFAGTNIAISLSSLTLVNSLQGIQYVFVILFAGILSYMKPKLLHEKISRTLIIEKGIAVVCIFIGLYLIAFYS